MKQAFTLYCCCAAAITLGLSAVAQPAAAEVNTGLACLAARQNVAGLWGNPTGSDWRDTATVLDTLYALGESSGLIYAKGVAQLRGLKATNNDHLARQITALSQAAEEFGVLTTSLLEAQTDDVLNPASANFPGGGWGAADGFESDPLDTALALRALQAANLPTGLTVAKESVVSGGTSPIHDFPVSAGSSDLTILVRETSGAMRLFVTTPSSGTFQIDLTPANVPIELIGLPIQAGSYSVRVQNLSAGPISYSLEARFSASGFEAARITQALSYLGLTQNGDGSWGTRRNSEGLLMVTAEVMRTLAAYGSAFVGPQVLNSGIAYLASKQAAGGGFAMQGASTAYETGLSLLAIAAVNPAHPSLAAGKTYLASTQASNGCWNNDAYATALATQALALGESVIVELGSNAGLRGGTACMAARMTANLHNVAETSLTLTFNPDVLTLIDCSINPTIGPSSSAGKSLARTTLGAGVERIDVSGGPKPILTGGLFVCRFQPAAGAPLGSHTIANVAVARNSVNATFPTQSTNGSVLVTSCTADCDGDGRVLIGEVVRSLNHFGGAPLCDAAEPTRSCPAADADNSGHVVIGEVVQSLNRFGVGCP